MSDAPKNGDGYYIDSCHNKSRALGLGGRDAFGERVSCDEDIVCSLKVVNHGHNWRARSVARGKEPTTAREQGLYLLRPRRTGERRSEIDGERSGKRRGCGFAFEWEGLRA